MYRRIRDLREDSDLTQKQIAQMLGMSQTGYSKYETGENDVPTAVLIKLADFYKTTTDYLLGRTDKKQKGGAHLPFAVIFVKLYGVQASSAGRYCRR